MRVQYKKGDVALKCAAYVHAHLHGKLAVGVDIRVADMLQLNKCVKMSTYIFPLNVCRCQCICLCCCTFTCTSARVGESEKRMCVYMRIYKHAHAHQHERAHDYQRSRVHDNADEIANVRVCAHLNAPVMYMYICTCMHVNIYT